MNVNVQDLLIQLFEESGYHREKQIRLKKLSFTGPPPGTYRFDKVYHSITDTKAAYLTTKCGKRMLEFFCKDLKVTIHKFGEKRKVIDLRDPDSIDEIVKLIDEQP